MGNRTVFWIVIGVLLIAAMVGVGYYAYSAGVVHGIAESAHATAGGAAPEVVWPRWGFGFGFFPVFPVFFFILLWVVLLRGLFWRGRGWGRACGYGYGSGVPPQFEEWHRRAHGQSGSLTASGTSNA
jgi:hypothetical protein